MTKSEQELVVLISTITIITCVLLLLFSDVFAQAAGFGDICNPVTGSPYSNYNPDLVANPIYATGEDYDNNANGCSWRLLPFTENDYRTPQTPITGVTTEYIEYSFVTRAAITDTVVSVQLNYVDEAGNNHPVVFDLSLLFSDNWQSFTIDFDGFSSDIGGPNSFVSMQFGVSDDQSDVLIDKIRMLAFGPSTATPTSTAIVQTPTTTPTPCGNWNLITTYDFSDSGQQNDFYGDMFCWSVSEQYLRFELNGETPLGTCAAPEEPHSIFIDYSTVYSTTYPADLIRIDGVDYIAHVRNNEYHLAKMNFGDGSSVCWQYGTIDDGICDDFTELSGAAGNASFSLIGQQNKTVSNFELLTVQSNGTPEAYRLDNMDFYIGCSASEATVTPTATPTNTLTATPTNFPLPTSTRTPGIVPSPTGTFTPISIPTSGTPLPTSTGISIPTIPAPGTPFPIPTPIVGGSCNSQIAGNYDFCFDYGFTELDCWIIIPTIQIISFPGFQICFELYGVVLKVFGYVFPTYLIIVAIAFLIIWRWIL